MVERLEIGLEFASTNLSMEGFFNKGRICALLKAKENTPWENDRMASLAMTADKR